MLKFLMVGVALVGMAGPVLAQDARVLAEGLPGVDVIEPQVMQPITVRSAPRP